jgi:hypothetical protein
MKGRPMRVHEFETHCEQGTGRLLHLLHAHVNQVVPDRQIPVRFFVSSTDADGGGYDCSIGVFEPGDMAPFQGLCPIFDIEPRRRAGSRDFNVVMIVPTGIGAEMGGHAGDATPAARLLGSLCDNLILHPNVVNSSTINEMPPNALYVEGSALTRLLMGTCGLQPVRANKVLVVLDGSAQKEVLDICVNMLSAARAVLGVDLEYIVLPGDNLFLLNADYTKGGAAVGDVMGLGNLLTAIEPHIGDFDALAIASGIDVPQGHAMRYMTEAGEKVNPWGGVEAMLTHTLTMILDKPCAHAPLMETLEEAEAQYGIVDPRKASEAAVGDYTYCLVKGLAKAPRIVSRSDPDAITVEDVDCVVMPDGCLGLPTLACFEQGIPLILVQNRNWMRNRPSALGPCVRVGNYMEAAGAVAALREGISFESLRRPIGKTRLCQ